MLKEENLTTQQKVLYQDPKWEDELASAQFGDYSYEQNEWEMVVLI